MNRPRFTLAHHSVRIFVISTTGHMPARLQTTMVIATAGDAARVRFSAVRVPSVNLTPRRGRLGER